MPNEITPRENIESGSLINIFTKNEILTEKDYKDLSDSIKFVEETYLTVPMYRSLPIKIFGVLQDKNCPTMEAKVWQCKAEAEIHANELIRDLHDLEIQKTRIERNKHMLNVIMKQKLDACDKDNDKETIKFDMKEMSITISRQNFEVAQLQKKIKYRIEELHEWKIISEKISTSKEFKNLSYSDMILDTFRQEWETKLNDPKITEPEKTRLLDNITSIGAIKSIK